MNYAEFITYKKYIKRELDIFGENAVKENLQN